jgi:hypothetical protein
MGITWCPGCGLGHSIAYFMHGDIYHSFHAHWLGIPAFFIICHRIYVLIKLNVFRDDRLTDKRSSAQLS